MSSIHISGLNSQTRSKGDDSSIEVKLIANDDNNTDNNWKSQHFPWVLPSNIGNSRYAYSKELKLNIKQEAKDAEQDDDDEEDETIEFKPWSNYKKKSKFQEIYRNLKDGKRRWHVSKHNSIFHDYIQIFLQFLVFILLSPVLLIEMIFIYGYVIISAIITFIKSFCISIFQSSSTAVFDDKHGILISGTASAIQSNRFAVYRLFHYVYWVTIHLFITLSRLIVGRQNVSLVEDDELIVYMHTNQHTKFEYDQDGNIVAGFIDNSDVIEIAEHQLYKGRYFPIRRIHLDYKTNVLSFTLNDDNKTVISNNNIDCSKSIWDLLKANYMSQRCIMDTLTHSWVHFHFADIVTSQLYTYFGNNPRTVLGRIIHSHFIYTSSINIAGAGDSFNQPQIKGDADDCINRLNPVKINPMKIEGAYSILRMRIIEHYYDEQGDTEFASPKNSTIHRTVNRNQFPPPQIRKRLELFSKDYKKYRGYSLYWDMLSDYYFAVYSFMQKLMKNKLIDESELDGFIKLVDENGMNGLSKCDKIHVLATLIWTNGYIHGADHTTYYNVMRNFPHLGVHNKLHINDKHDDKEHWTKYYRSWKSNWISFKSEIFIHTFTQPIKSCFNKIADYSSSPLLYRKFENIPYLNKGKGGRLESVNNFHDDYLKLINKISDKYNWMMDVNQLDASISY